MLGTALTLDLTTLPPARRERVLETWNRERAAERIREVYPVKIAMYREAEAFRRTAEAVKTENRAWGFVTARWVQRVMREGR